MKKALDLDGPSLDVLWEKMKGVQFLLGMEKYIRVRGDASYQVPTNSERIQRLEADAAELDAQFCDLMNRSLR